MGLWEGRTHTAQGAHHRLGGALEIPTGSGSGARTPRRVLITDWGGALETPTGLWEGRSTPRRLLITDWEGLWRPQRGSGRGTRTPCRVLITDWGGFGDPNGLWEGRTHTAGSPSSIPTAQHSTPSLPHANVHDHGEGWREECTRVSPDCSTSELQGHDAHAPAQGTAAVHLPRRAHARLPCGFKSPRSPPLGALTALRNLDSQVRRLGPCPHGHPSLTSACCSRPPPRGTLLPAGGAQGRRGASVPGEVDPT